MKIATGILWFALSFLTGAALYLATAPRPVLQALLVELRGGNVFERCQRAAQCSKLIEAPPHPGRYQMAPPGLDRG